MSAHKPLAAASAGGHAGGDAASSVEDADTGDGEDPRPRLLPVPAAWWTAPAVVARTLPARPDAVPLARRFTADTLASWGLQEFVDRAEAIVDELVANAVRHGVGQAGETRPQRDGDTRRRSWEDRCHTPLRVCALRRASEVMIAALDPSARPPMPRHGDPTEEGGRGLRIVDALSDVWGWSPLEGRGKAVWAVLRLR